MKRATLNELTAFLAIAEHLNFRRAAVELGVTPSALSHTIRTLERRVNVQLLLRSTRSVALTEAGMRLAAKLRPALADVGEALGQLAEHGDALSGRIAITASEQGGRLLIERIFGSFRRLHPQVRLEVCSELALADLIASGCDAGVRLRAQVPPDMIAVPIGPAVAVVACASPAYLHQRAAPETPADLPGHECIRQRLSTGAICRWEFESRGEPLFFDPQGALTFNSHGHVVAAALLGLGIAYVPSHHVDTYLAAGALVQVLPGYSKPLEGFCLYYPSTRHPTKTFKAFVDHVRSVVRHPLAAENTHHPL
jgi:DNA-binding transcriptional LysR family regulator